MFVSGRKVSSKKKTRRVKSFLTYFIRFVCGTNKRFYNTIILILNEIFEGSRDPHTLKIRLRPPEKEFFLYIIFYLLSKGYEIYEREITRRIRMLGYARVPLS